MRSIVQATDERSARSRVDRSIQTGIVISVDKVAYRCILDVGMVDFVGVPVYMEVPFTPQTPPQVNDTVTIMRTNSSPYSHVLGAGAQVGGANSSGTVDGVGGTGTDATPTSRGQIMYSLDGAAWTAETPLAGDTGILITEDETGYLVVAG